MKLFMRYDVNLEHDPPYHRECRKILGFKLVFVIDFCFIIGVKIVLEV